MNPNISKLKKYLPVALGGMLLTASIGLMSNSSSDDKRDSKAFSEASFKVDTVATGLSMPWASALLPGGELLVTERGGKLRIVRNGKLDAQEVTGIPEVWYKGQGGLLDIALHPDYKSNGWIYISYSSPKKEGEEGDDGGANTALMRAKLKGNALTDIQHLFKAIPNVKGNVHFGGRIVFDKKGYVFLSLGERGQKENSQNLGRDQGKVVRLHEDGKIPSDNPFVKTAGARPEIWTYGHRNPQGLIINPATGVIWEHEHGPQGGDELNIIEKGKNYGWPLITYGIDYDNSIISKDTAKAGLEQPVIYWKPSIAPCGMTFLSNDKYKDWKGDLLVGSLKFMYLQHLTVRGNKVTKREVIFDKIGRVRDVRMGSDGNVYVVLENSGKVVRLTPKG
ncbi:PQQ-dependent sugar dehydrogenase [Dyadobacter fermentans]|uniref:Glucose sorbosone dehydrogenase n=1 Tax=Dyadobacter fermentans (strain ATCC 700827 / DSM 18053 / CIP 107007 / KCTC 52180 / NS114) TaxID=471854 RepID=C6W5R9_DYAFD|nr:PQQ-dependent sugar dehydrogenase [Dyadobacter fermentans]ACT96008.1 glucose sorbosone dehydrogenase [Dyadobacter fermentans DSM 18053]